MRVSWIAAAALMVVPTVGWANPHAENPEACEQVPGHPSMEEIASMAAPVAGMRVGTVVETMTSGGYTYAMLDVSDELVWVAGPETQLEIGDQVSTSQGALMANFHSRTLDRTFKRIWFVATLQSGDPVADAHPTLTPGADDEVAVEPLEGGFTVAEVVNGASGLSGKTVEIRGVVVKVTANVMNRNWVHLQDGTGSADDNTHNLTVTTTDEAEVGDVVVIRGVVAADRDFGAGYRYAAIVEDAQIASRNGS